ncbi:MAG: FG-GAP repeat protein [Candidatus Nanopelagicales bacterium]
MGVPGEVTGTGNGAVHVLRGDAAGLTATGSQFLTAGSTGAGWPPRAQAGFGSSLVLGDLDGNGRKDLVVGTPLGAVNQGGEPIGTVAVLAASGNGPVRVGARRRRPDRRRDHRGGPGDVAGQHGDPGRR